MTEIAESHDQLYNELHFPCPLYWVEKPEFLESIKEVAEDFLSKVKKDRPEADKIFPVYMSEGITNDPRVHDLMMYILNTSWNILREQGHDMKNFNTVMQEMWVQEHLLRSSNEEHVHGYGSQITGFYVLEAPENSSMIAIHDPRAAKKQINLPPEDHEVLSMASSTVYFKPTPGKLYLHNSWLPHEITRNFSEQPVKFIHFNVGVMWNPIPQTEENTTPVGIPLEIV